MLASGCYMNRRTKAVSAAIARQWRIPTEPKTPKSVVDDGIINSYHNLLISPPGCRQAGRASAPARGGAIGMAPPQITWRMSN
jgi:hypothetical protein